jgi:hypothetical protein
VTNQAAIDYLESDFYFANAFARKRAGGNVIRDMFQVFTDHKFDSVAMEASYGYGSEMMYFATGAADCEKCGTDPIILGPDGADYE